MLDTRRRHSEQQSSTGVALSLTFSRRVRRIMTLTRRSGMPVMIFPQKRLVCISLRRPATTVVWQIRQSEMRSTRIGKRPAEILRVGGEDSDRRLLQDGGCHF